MKWNDLETFTSGDNPSLADDLAALVLAGRKRATCWAACDGNLTQVGKRTVMVDGGGRPCAAELVQRRFEDVDAAFAFEEGEGGSTLAYWRQAHRDYFSRKNQFTEDMLLWCERFRVVETIAVL